MSARAQCDELLGFYMQIALTFWIAFVFGYFSLLGSDILLSTLFSDPLSLFNSLSLRDQVSHTYKATGEIIVLYILISEVFREEMGRWKILNWMGNAILIC